MVCLIGGRCRNILTTQDPNSWLADFWASAPFFAAMDNRYLHCVPDSIRDLLLLSAVRVSIVRCQNTVVLLALEQVIALVRDARARFA